MLMGNASKILQTVSANIDRDVLELALMQLGDLIMLTDTSGLLTGEEKISVQGVNVAIQRETQRQRQIEFAQATQNPVDMKIIGLKGRASIIRSIAATIGMGSDVVPPEDVIEKMDQQQQQQEQQGGVDAAIQKAVQQGVDAGVKRIATELTAGVLASRAHMPEGPPAHIGTPEQNPGPTSTGGTDLASMAAAGQGAQPSRISGNQMGPTTALTGNMRGPNALPVHGGVG